MPDDQDLAAYVCASLARATHRALDGEGVGPTATMWVGEDAVVIEPFDAHLYIAQRGMPDAIVLGDMGITTEEPRRDFEDAHEAYHRGEEGVRLTLVVCGSDGTDFLVAGQDFDLTADVPTVAGEPYGIDMEDGRVHGIDDMIGFLRHLFDPRRAAAVNN